MMPLKLLISPQNKQEAAQAIAGGADIIDVKNPAEGALGANYPWVIQQIRDATPNPIKLSCTLGDMGSYPGAVSLAALGAASLGVDYIKVGLFGVKTVEEAVFLVQNVSRAAKESKPDIKVVVAGYADAQNIGALSPMQIPEIAHKAGAAVAMIDTYIKDGKNLFDHLTCQQLTAFVQAAHMYGLEAALAGSLRKQDLPVIAGLGADIVGLRGAVCTGCDRVAGQIRMEKVAELVKVLRQTKPELCIKKA